jgi:RNA polymerase sigma-70 factor (ECF subfamily)
MAERIEDELLIKQFKNDESAFDIIVEQYSNAVAELANRLLGWPGDVEDITQDIFLAAYLGLRRFRCQCSLKTWLFTITINKCRSFKYKQIFHRHRIVNKHNEHLPPTADKKLLDDDTFEKVRHAVQSLPAKYREPVVLRYLQELQIEDISKILGISINTLHVRLNRAREQLKQDLAEIMEI